MRSRRPINQHHLRHPLPHVESGLAAAIVAGFAAFMVSAEQYVLATRDVARAVHAWHRKPCYCLQPRRVATQLRRRDRKKARQR